MKPGKRPSIKVSVQMLVDVSFIMLGAPAGSKKEGNKIETLTVGEEEEEKKKAVNSGHLVP
jgi:hypothetical protein